MAVKASLRVLLVKLSFLFLGDETLLGLQQIHVQLYVEFFFCWYVSSHRIS